MTYIGEEDALVVILVGSWEADQLVSACLSISVTSDGDLGARGVEFSAPEGGAKMESNDLVTEEVVPGGEVRWDGDSGRCAVHCERLCQYKHRVTAK